MSHLMQTKKLDMLIIHVGMELDMLIIYVGAEFAQDPLSLPSGPITRLKAKRFKEALNGIIKRMGLTLKRPRWVQIIIKVN
jgi:hypothetical protein